MTTTEKIAENKKTQGQIFLGKILAERSVDQLVGIETSEEMKEKTRIEISEAIEKIRPEYFSSDFDRKVFAILSGGGGLEECAKFDYGMPRKQSRATIFEYSDTAMTSGSLKAITEAFLEDVKKDRAVKVIHSTFTRVPDLAEIGFLGEKLEKITQKEQEDVKYFVGMEEAVESYIQNIDESKGQRKAYLTGIPALDADNRGDFKMRPGELVVVGARPGVGKSAFALGLTYRWAKEGAKVTTINLEMSVNENVHRLLAIAGGVEKKSFGMREVEQYVTGNFDPVKTPISDDFIELSGILSGLPIKIMTLETKKGLSDIDVLIRTVKLQKLDVGLDVLVVDYLGLLFSPGFSSKVYEIADITRKLKILAQELNIVILLLCQLNRKSMMANAEPNLTDLRDSGAIEQDADKVMFIHKAQQEDPENKEVELIIAKNRSGRGFSKTPMIFDGKTMIFVPFDRR
jgi:replicative DNA helicase